MCLWRRDTQRSSSSSRRTSLTRASPMPLVSYLGRGQEGGEDGARGHTWLRGGDMGQVGAALGSASGGARLFQFDLIPTALYPFIGWEGV